MTTPLYWNYCKFVSSTSGTAAFTVGSAAPSDGAGAHDVPENCNVVDGNTYKYYATNGTQDEGGLGVYNKASHTLTRVTIAVNSDNTTLPVNFTSAPTVDLFPNPTKTVEFDTTDFFQSGTSLTFQQTSAPLGWTKQTTHNDKVLRVVSGTAGSGGTNTFTATFAYRTDDAVTLSLSQIPSHPHGPPGGVDTGFIFGDTGFGSVTLASGSGGPSVDASSGTATGSAGGSGSHAHTYDMRVQYVDLIIAMKA